MNRRDHLGCLICGLTGFAAWAAPVLAESDPQPSIEILDCRAGAAAPPRIGVTAVGTPQPPVDRSLSVMELTQKAHGLGGLHAQFGRVLGLTRAQFGYKIKKIHIGASISGAQACVRPLEIGIELHVTQQVFVVKSATDDPCWNPAIFGHEMQHVGFNNDAIEAARGELDRRLNGLAPVAVPLGEAQSAGNQLGDQVQALIKVAIDDAVVTSKPRHASIDTPALYAQTFRMCVQEALARKR